MTGTRMQKGPAMSVLPEMPILSQGELRRTVEKIGVKVSSLEMILRLM